MYLSAGIITVIVVVVKSQLKLRLTKMSDMPVTLVMGRIGQNYNKEKSKSETINIS